MKIFTIQAETNNIMVHGPMKEAAAIEGAERFRNETGLATLAEGWPMNRLVEIWNGLPGATPVKKFKDRNTAVARIWKGIQNLGGTATETAEPLERTPETNDTVGGVAPQTPEVALDEQAAPHKGSRAKKEPAGAAKAPSAREGSKTETVLALLRRVGGVTASELMTATGWQAHSIRGFVSGTLRKKMGLNVVSAKGENGERTYSVTA